jgi:hypothetical protein
MGRADEVLNLILEEARKSGHRTLMQDVYGDEPLIRTGREAFGPQESQRRSGPQCGSFPSDSRRDESGRGPRGRVGYDFCDETVHSRRSEPGRNDGGEAGRRTEKDQHNEAGRRADASQRSEASRRAEVGQRNETARHVDAQRVLRPTYDDEPIPHRPDRTPSRQAAGEGRPGAPRQGAGRSAGYAGRYDRFSTIPHTDVYADLYPEARTHVRRCDDAAGPSNGSSSLAGSGPADGNAGEPLPDRIAKMRELQGAGWPSPYAGKLKTFYDQARLMADYTDEQAFDGAFVAYYPTYEDLPNRVLRGYFTWRTRWRRGEQPEAPLSFLFLYVYEILCGVGIEPGERGLRELARVKEVYGGKPGNRALSGYLRTWMRDYVVYYGLDAGLLEGSQEASGLAHAVDLMRKVQDALVAGSVSTEQILATFVQRPCGRRTAMSAPDRKTSKEPAWRLFEAMADGSSYNVRHSKAYASRPEVFAEVACGVFCELVAYCRKHRKTTFVDGLFGVPTSRWYYMFNSAVFYAEHVHPDVRVELPSGEAFVCRDGRWTRESPMGKIAPSQDLGAIMHAVDAGIRDRLGIQPPLKPRAIPKYVQAIVEGQVQRCLNRIEAEEAARVVIDRSKLSGIRHAASRTEEALLVDEERAHDGEAVCGQEEPAPAPAAEPSFLELAQTCGNPSAPWPTSSEDSTAAEPEPPLTLWDVETAETPQEVLTEGAPTTSATAPKGVPTTSAAAPEIAPGPDAAPVAGLEGRQLQMVRALLDGTFDRTSFEKTGAMTALVADEVNEALFDLVGDAVIAFDGDDPYLIEDYEPDVREMLAS